MAIESLEAAIARYDTPIYVFHEIVHNRWVVERFRKLGVVFVDALSDIPEGAHVLYSAHGVSPAVRQSARQRRLQVIDATCPLVTKVHREAFRFAAEGYTIVLIGHEGHDEVVGTMGEAPDSIVVVASVDDVERLQVRDLDKVAYLTQTTLSVGDAAKIIERLRAKYPHVVGPRNDDICYATQNRQQAVEELSRQADLVLVVGSCNSSNSRRLAELATSHGVRSQLIDGPDDLRSEWFADDMTVLITAGASAPEDVVQDCVAWLHQRFESTVETAIVRDEDVRFILPRELR
jgi:4-hydroxy-3-methylbut-2-enyl diphosphate reductase